MVVYEGTNCSTDARCAMEALAGVPSAVRRGQLTERNEADVLEFVHAVDYTMKYSG